jgi:hypothetical protein
MTDVIHHLTALVGSVEALQQSPEILAALRKWYETHRVHIQLPNGTIGLVTEGGNAGEADNGDFLYYDNQLKVSFCFNPFTLVSFIVSEEPMQVPTSAMRDSLVSHVEAYTAKAFRQGKVLF